MKCTGCGKDIDSDLKFCPECGKPTTVNKIMCTKCGHEIDSNLKFCPECGKSVNDYKDKHDKDKDKNYRDRRRKDRGGDDDDDDEGGIFGGIGDVIGGIFGK